MKVHILDDSFDTLRGLPSFGRLAAHDVKVWTDGVGDVEELARRLSDVEALVLFRERTPLGADLVARLPKLRLVSQHGGYGHVDVDALTRRGILLCSAVAPEAPSSAAAEHTFALILAAARDLPRQVESARAGTWQAGVGRSLHGRTIGLYGYGRLGRMVARYARTFGMKVVWWASEAGRACAAADGEIVATSRRAFFAEPDFVSLHVRLMPATRGIVTADDLAAMRPDATLVNTARAALIAPGALLAALDAGRPGRAALDVFDAEPVIDPRDPIISHPRVLPTPHVGFVTEDELDAQFDGIYDQINAFASGTPINVMNPEAHR